MLCEVYLLTKNSFNPFPAQRSALLVQCFLSREVLPFKKFHRDVMVTRNGHVRMRTKLEFKQDITVLPRSCENAYKV